MLKNLAFRALLQLEPVVHELVVDFYLSHMIDFLNILERLRGGDLELDLYLGVD